MIKIGIIGATGYTGGELLRYLLRHPQARVLHCTSESSAGKSVFLPHPDLSRFAGRKVALRLENFPNDWSYEFAYWAEVTLNPAALARGN